MANIDYDDHYEWLCEKAEIRQRLAKEWLRETIAAGDADELYIPIGDDLTPLLLALTHRTPAQNALLGAILVGGEGGEPRMLRAYETGLGGNLHAGFSGDVAGKASARIVEEGASAEFGRYVDVRIDFTLRLSADRTAASQRTRPGRDTEDYGLDMLGSGLEQVLEGQSIVRWSVDANAPARILTEAEEGTRVSVRLLEPGGTVAQQELDMSGELSLTTRFRTRARVGSARKR